MVFVIVAFILCYLESFIFKAFESIFSICTLCTLLNEGDKSETKIGAYKPLGFLSHLQHNSVIFVST